MLPGSHWLDFLVNTFLFHQSSVSSYFIICRVTKGRMFYIKIMVPSSHSILINVYSDDICLCLIPFMVAFADKRRGQKVVEDAFSITLLKWIQSVKCHFILTHNDIHYAVRFTWYFEIVWFAAILDFPIVQRKTVIYTSLIQLYSWVLYSGWCDLPIYNFCPCYPFVM